MRGGKFILPKLQPSSPPSHTAEQSPQIAPNGHPFIELGRRKSSKSQSLSPGVPFLQPVANNAHNKNNGTVSGKKTFFIHKNPEINPRQVLTDILNQIGTLSRQAVIIICQNYNLIPPNHATLLKFVSEISPNDKSAVAQFHNIFTNVMQQVRQNVPLPSLLTETRASQMPLHQKIIVPNFLPISHFHFYDPRYTHSQFETNVIAQPMPIAHENQNFTLQIPDQPIGTHIIIQSFTRDGKIYWPNTLRVYVNDILLKGPGVCKLNQIDLFKFPRCSVRIQCNRESVIAALIIRPAVYQSFTDLVNHMKENQYQQDVPVSDNEQALCPITGKVLKYPGRGILCQHLQCFNLKEYIKRCTASRAWFCPICNMPLPIKQLMYSHEMENKIAASKQDAQKADDGYEENDYNINENDFNVDGGDTWM